MIALREDSVLGTYRVQGLLGRGGTAEVWEVRHTLLGTRHALKVPTLWRGRPLQRLLREARVQARLRHPNLLAVQGLLELEGRPALLLPLVEGPSLSRLLSVYRPAAREGIALVRSIAEGVGFAHASGLVHRDLKPSNVLLELVGGVVVARVSDFGLVKEWGVSSSLTGGGSVGTPLYMSPEQLRSPGEVDRRADLWSLGVILFELLTGALPFNARSLPELIEAHRRPLAAAQLTDEQASVLRALLDPDPGGRPASCEALLEQLDAMNGPGPDPLVAGSSLADAVSAMSRRRPPSLSASALHNLPARRDRFLGRAAELSSLEGRLAAGARLISLVGPGGVGKTRLAGQLGRACLGRWPGGIWFCDLSAASDEAGVLNAVGAALGLRLMTDAAARLAWAIEGLGRVLLILDNFEQVTDVAAATVGRWLNTAPQASFLVTSRQPLGLRGEELAPIEPLVPEDAVALLSERAGVELGPADPLARRAVSLLDGLPLAIELAAPLATEGPLALIERLEGAAGLALEATDSALPDRHRTLDAALAWSWSLLDPRQRAAVSQCSVFVGGFTLAAAEAVLEIPGAQLQPGGFWLEDLLSELADRSLLQVREGPDGEARFSMLSSVRWFAQRQLVGEERLAAERRHGGWYARLGSPAALAALEHPGAQASWRALSLERRNIVAAVERAMAREEPAVVEPAARAAGTIAARLGPFEEGAARLTAALGWLEARGEASLRLRCQAANLLRILGRLSEARALLEAAAIDGQSDDPALSGYHLIEALLHFSASDNAGMRRHLEAALATARRQHDRATEGTALGRLGDLARREGRLDEARSLLDASLAIARGHGSESAVAMCQAYLALVHQQRGELRASLEHHEQALALRRGLGDELLVGITLSNMATPLRQLGRLEESERCCREAIARYRQSGYRRGVGFARADLGQLALLRARFGDALAHFEAALQAHRQVGNQRSAAIAMTNIGVVSGNLGQRARALEMLEQALEIHRALGNRRTEGEALAELAALAGEEQPQQALAYYRASIALARSHDNRDAVALTEARMAAFLASRGDAAGAHGARLRALEEAEGLDSTLIVGGVLAACGQAALALGRLDLAAADLERASSILRSQGDTFGLAGALLDVAALALRGGRREQAEAAAAEARALARELSLPGEAPICRKLRALEAQLQGT